MATLQLSAENSIVVQVTLTNPVTSLPINDATVVGRIDTYEDVEVIPEFSIPYIAASDGIYRATINPDPDIVNGTTYKVIIDSTTPDSLVGHWECCVKAEKATGC